MKVLFDQSADFRLIPHLSGLGHDVQAISRNYPHGLLDEDVLEIARKEQRILIVADRDFGELIFQQELAHAGVIFFRLPGASLETKIEHLIPCSANTPTSRARRIPGGDSRPGSRCGSPMYLDGSG